MIYSLGAKIFLLILCNIKIIAIFDLLNYNLK